MMFAHINWGPGHYLATAILDARKEANMRVREVALPANLTLNRYSAIEHGRAVPTERELDAIARMLGVGYDTRCLWQFKRAEAQEDADHEAASRGG